MRIIATTPYLDQQPGTSGLRKQTAVFENNPHYLENFIQSSINVLNVDKQLPVFIGGDGRYYNEHAILQTLRILLANDFTDIRVGQYGFMSTPAASHLIRRYQAAFAFIFSASHNPGGKAGDVGIKVNVSNGGPAPLEVTEATFLESQKISAYFLAELDNLDLTQCGKRQIDKATVSVIDSVSDYVDLMQEVFDFDLIRRYLSKNAFCFDAMHAITGPYAKAIFCQQLGVAEEHILNAQPLPDFGGIHPDPSPTTAKHIYQLSQSPDCPFALLAASDGDGDRNMILGKGIFINPSDSLAIIAAYAGHIPYYQRYPLTGVARSLPTSRAVDAVADSKQLPCYATPTGWKFFGNLLDSEKIGLCGEESFGTSGSHIREKDGIWTVLYWLNILAATGKTAKEIVTSHWQTFGRHYYCRYDFEQLDGQQAAQLLAALDEQSVAGLSFANVGVSLSGQFDYTDPTDGSVTRNQGYQVVFAYKARFIIRLSGTGTTGATLRLYLEVFDKDSEKPLAEVIKPLADLAIDFIAIKKHCGTNTPSQIV